MNNDDFNEFEIMKVVNNFILDIKYNLIKINNIKKF